MDSSNSQQQGSAIEHYRRVLDSATSVPLFNELKKNPEALAVLAAADHLAATITQGISRLEAILKVR
jgi:hypothetical protein